MEEQITVQNENNMHEINPRLNSATGGWAYSALVIFYLGISLIASILIGVVTSLVMVKHGFETVNEASEFISKNDAYLYIMYLMSPIAISLAALTVIKVRKITFKQVFPVKCHPKYYLIGVLLIFGLLFSLSWVNDVSVKFFELFGYKQRESSSYFPNLSGGYVVLGLLVIAVMPAFFEELMFRGILFNCCEKNMGAVRAIFVTGFCFSLFHASPEQTVYQFIVGCAFAFIALRSGSILPSMLMHFINNAIIVIFQASSALDEAGELMMSNAVSITITVLSALSLVGALIWLILDRKPVTKCVKGGVRTFFIYGSLAIAALGIMWLLSLFGVV